MFDKAFLATVLTWVEHALVVAGLAGIADLGNNVANLGLSQALVIIIVAAFGILARAINKFQPKPAPSTMRH